MKTACSPSGEVAIKSVCVLEKLALDNQDGAASMEDPEIEKKKILLLEYPKLFNMWVKYTVYIYHTPEMVSYTSSLPFNESLLKPFNNTIG